MDSSLEFQFRLYCGTPHRDSAEAGVKVGSRRHCMLSRKELRVSWSCTYSKSEKLKFMLWNIGVAKLFIKPGCFVH